MIARKAKNQQIYFTMLISSLLLASCTVVQKPFELKQHATEYAETLYKRQNLATQQVMFLLEEDISAEEEEQLSDAELEMYQACELLNEVASREQEGEAISLYFKKQVQGSFNACDDSVKKMELLLQQLSNDQ